MAKPKAPPKAIECLFVGGPKDGEYIRLINPPPDEVVIMFPSRGVYKHIGTEFVLQED